MELAKGPRFKSRDYRPSFGQDSWGLTPVRPCSSNSIIILVYIVLYIMADCMGSVLILDFRFWGWDVHEMYNTNVLYISTHISVGVNSMHFLFFLYFLCFRGGGDLGFGGGGGIPQEIAGNNTAWGDTLFALMPRRSHSGNAVCNLEVKICLKMNDINIELNDESHRCLPW